MPHDEIQMMLMEYAEGTLDDSQRKIVEEKLKHSAELRNDLQSIQHALARLHVVEDPEIPSHYFSNFLPRLHEKLDRVQGRTFFAVPIWVRRALVPAVTAVLVGSGIGLYYVLQPANSRGALYEIAQELNQTELDDTISYDPLTDSGLLFTTNVENVVSGALIESDFSKNILPSVVLASNSIDDNDINDRQLVTQLDDDEIEMILNRLNSNDVH